ncbi:hypothetical protein CSB11_00685 [Candidatus Campbellbacteria bacterium]|nr:MAG: hypothetical protein CSB11_00685 [Candidatus Campbellbacteria bacterium]
MNNIDNKNFNQWNKIKKKTHSFNNSEVFINNREIWFVKLGYNIGFEQDGKNENYQRPVLVLKRLGNMFLVLPLTSSGKNNQFYHKFNPNNLKLENPKYRNSSYAILSQIKTIDKKRFFKNVGVVSSNEFKMVKEKLKTFLF